jgi:glycosyltransferase involved in cell wall biosynthesis
LADRILYLISQYPTVSHSFILREIRELRNLGLTIDVVSIRNPDRPVAELTAEEIHEAEHTYYVRADTSKWPLAHLRVFFTRPGAYVRGLVLAVRYSKWNLLQLARHLRFFAEAILVGHWAQTRGLRHVHTHFASLTATLTQKVFGLALSMTIHGSDEFIDPVGFCMAEKLDAGQLAIGISRYGCSQIMRFSDPKDWHKVKMARLGINLDEFPLSTDATALPGFRVICVGRLVPVKAYRFLLEAVAILAKAGHLVSLTIIGGGPELAALRNLAAQLQIAVEFTGPLPNVAVRERLRCSHCFALASFAEGVPVAVMEAMALGVPCVATRVTGVPELIEDGRDGLLVPPADSEALAAAIERLILDPSLRSQFAENGRSKVFADYNLKENARVLKDYLKNCP